MSSKPQETPQGPHQNNKQIMNLKVLYTLDDETTFLGRSSKPSLVRVFQLPGSHIQIGAVDLKKCLQIVLQSSPELVNDDLDYSCYSKDISEPDEPFVGHGMVSSLKDKKGEILVPGRVCTSFASLLGGSNSNETVEVKLKLLKMTRLRVASDMPLPLPQSLDLEDDFIAPQGRYYKRTAHNVQIPVKASRTKSLPVSYNQQQQQQQQSQTQSHKRPAANLSLRMSSMASSGVLAQRSQSTMGTNVAANMGTAAATSSPILDIFQEPKRIKLDDSAATKKKPSCLECGTHESKTWKIVKNPLKQLQYRTGVLCNDCNATMLRSGISTVARQTVYGQNKTKKQNHVQQLPSKSTANASVNTVNTVNTHPTSSPSIPHLNNVDISEIFSMECDVSRYGGPLTDIDPLPQQPTPVDEPSRATRLNTTLIDMDEDNKENVQPPVSPNRRPISVLNSDKHTDFEAMLAQSFQEFTAVKSPMDSPNKKGAWLNVLFSHAEEDEHRVKQDDEYNRKKQQYAKTPSDDCVSRHPAKENIASSPPMYTTPYKDDDNGTNTSLDKVHSSILTSINDDITSLTHWDHSKVSPPTSFLGDDGDETEDEKM